MSSRGERRARVARPLLAAINGGPAWLDRIVPESVYVALLKAKHEQEDRETRALWDESSRRAREAWVAQREANGPGCDYCPNTVLDSVDDDGTRYKACPACGASRPLGDSPDPVDNPYDELRPLRSATDDEL